MKGLLRLRSRRGQESVVDIEADEIEFQSEGNQAADLRTAVGDAIKELQEIQSSLDDLEETLEALC